MNTVERKLWSEQRLPLMEKRHREARHHESESLHYLALSRCYEVGTVERAGLERITCAHATLASLAYAYAIDWLVSAA